jgi:hypothetical protein
MEGCSTSMHSSTREDTRSQRQAKTYIKQSGTLMGRLVSVLLNNADWQVQVNKVVSLT